MDNLGNKRIAKNTAILYVRLIFTMLIGLYTSRLILKNLGVNDFGIYNVVGGVVSMFAVVSSSLSAAISRFLTFKLGQNDIDGLRLAFSTSVFIQFLLCLIIVILAEPIGLWFMHNKMTIPLGRIPAAEWVFHFSLVTFCLDLINVPYRSLIIAHERMDVYSYLSIFEVAAKLLVVVLLVVAPIDRLVFYSLLLVLVSLVSRIVYGIYCSRNFIECKINFVPSLRIDAVIAEVLRTSRGKAEEFLEEGRVFLNYEQISKGTKQIKEKDILTIRGKGKFEIGSREGTTKSGRIKIIVEQFV